MASHPTDNPTLAIFWKNRYTPPLGVLAQAFFVAMVAPPYVNGNSIDVWAAIGIVLCVVMVADLHRPGFRRSLLADGLPLSTHLLAVPIGVWIGSIMWIDSAATKVPEFTYLGSAIILAVIIGQLQFGSSGWAGPILMAAALLTAALALAVARNWPFVISTLFLSVVSVRASLASARTFDELSRLRAESVSRAEIASWHADHDVLTGLLNRRGLTSLVGSRATDFSHVMLVDLDHFKAINDNFGHETGDDVLCAVSARLTETLHGQGVAARLGGDEYVVLLRNKHNNNSRDATEIANRLLVAIRRPIVSGSRAVSITASIGVASVAPDSTLADLLRESDAALYQAKRSGRDQAAPMAAPIESATTTPAPVGQTVKEGSGLPAA